MRILSILACLLSSFTAALCDEREFGTVSVAVNPSPTELERLQQDYARKRAEALRPVAAWYREQLEVLQKQLLTDSPGSEAEVAEVLRTAKEKFWQEDQPELSPALVGGPWLWRSNDDPHGVTVTFRADATVEHIGMRGTWRVSGPSEVTINTEEGERYVLRFNTSLSAYEADHRNVSGVRLATVP